MFLGLVAVVLLGWVGSAIWNAFVQAKKYVQMKPEIARIQSLELKLSQQEVALQEKAKQDHGQMLQREKALEQKIEYGKSVVEYLASEKGKGFPWLAKAYADFFEIWDGGLADHLIAKQHPAFKAAEVVRQMSKERREAEKAARQTQYLLDYCMELDPWLKDYVGMEAAELESVIDEIHSAWEKKEEEFEEEVKHHLGPKYLNLAPPERLQRKLDWWWEKPNKTDWQIGREYERYVGHLYENRGWDVYYHGQKGFEDLGRDLICKKGKDVEIIQCKRWRQEKEIHEKHIYALFGTTVDYVLEQPETAKPTQLAFFPELLREKRVAPKLITTARASSKAEQAARMLGVGIVKLPFERFPSVKCNVSRRTGERIYHLPFDQQYDTILIEQERMERYVETVAEAEALGFRHAFRWKGEDTVDTGELVG